MRCEQCGGQYVEISGPLSEFDKEVGTINVPNATYYKCDSCSDILYSADTSKSLDEAKIIQKNQLLSLFPVKDYISASETSKLLGITRQALNKNRKIRRGFIHQFTFGGALIYLRDSVIQFKEKGDGRFPLIRTKPGISTSNYYEIKQIQSLEVSRYFHSQIKSLSSQPFSLPQIFRRETEYDRR
jgi:hypothetical protein